MTKQDIEFGKLYQYPFSAMIYPVDGGFVTQEWERNQINRLTPFVVLDLTIPKGFTGEVLKVLTSDGIVGYIGFTNNFLEKVSDNGE